MGSANGTSSVDTLAELRALSRIIQESIENIESAITSKHLQFPSPYTPLTMESEGVRMLPEVDKECSLIVSAATQLVYATRSPMQSIVALATGHNLPAALGVAAAANVVEACREAGPQGAHVSELARASNIDSSKLARALRTLATNHIFVEVSPDVFANNRVSSAMDTGKSVKDILASPETKHVGTSGIAAGVLHCIDEAMKASSYLQDTLLDTKLAKSQKPNETALNAAFKTDLGIFEWFEAKGNEDRLLRFGIAMEGAKQAALPTAILEGFDWEGLGKDAVVVDVGGGVGAQSLTLAQHHAHLRFVVQDREQVTKDAVGFWNGQMPDALESGRVTLQAHDFFAPQPIKNAGVFLLRNIMHDWSDAYCIQILRHLRAAAAPFTQLVIVDNIMSYACVEEDLKTIPGAERPLPPAPLLPNGGHAATIPYFQDIQMLSLMNGMERTVTQTRVLMEQTGWKLVQVHQGSGFSTQKAIGIPA